MSCVEDCEYAECHGEKDGENEGGMATDESRDVHIEKVLEGVEAIRTKRNFQA